MVSKAVLRYRFESIILLSEAFGCTVNRRSELSQFGFDHKTLSGRGLHFHNILVVVPGGVK